MSSEKEEPSIRERLNQEFAEGGLTDMLLSLLTALIIWDSLDMIVSIGWLLAFPAAIVLTGLWVSGTMLASHRLVGRPLEDYRPWMMCSSWNTLINGAAIGLCWLLR